MFEHLPPAWQSCVEAFLAHYSKHRAELYRKALRRFFRDDPGRSPADYTQQDILTYLNRPSESHRTRGQALATATQDLHLQAIAALYRFAGSYMPTPGGAPLFAGTSPTNGIPYGGPRYYQATRDRQRTDRPASLPRDYFGQLPQPWQSCIEAYLCSVRDKTGAASSYSTYRSYLSRFFRFIGKPPDEVTRTDVLAWIASPAQARSNQGGEASPSCKNLRRCTLTGLYAFASDYEVDGQPLYQKSSPTRNMKHMDTDIHFRAMPQKDLAAFFAVLGDSIIDRRDRALYGLYFWTARRESELISLLWGEIVQETIIDPDGTDRIGYTFTYRPKGKHRTVKKQEMPEPAYKLIVSYLEASGRLAHMTPDSPVFVAVHLGKGRRGGGAAGEEIPLDHRYPNTRFKLICQRAGLSPAYTLHVLRHTAARARYLETRDIIAVSETLGHERIDTTMRYIGAMNGQSDPTARRLEARFAFISDP